MRDSVREAIEVALAQSRRNYRVPHVQHYSGFGEYLDAVAAVPEQYRMDNFGDYGNSYEDVIAKARIGNAELGEKAKKLIEDMDNEGLLATGPSALGASVVGFMPLVPAYLTGHPEAMLARVEHSSSKAPIRIYMGIGSGGWVGEDQIMQRGVAITALVLALSTVRPVELFAWTANAPGSTNEPSFRTWPVQTWPLDLPSLGYQIGTGAIHHVFAFSLARQDRNLAYANYPYPYDGKRDLIAKIARIAFECEDDDLVIPRVTDASNDPLINDPIGWLKETLAVHMGGDDESELAD